MTDITRHKSNIKKMIDGGATEQEIDSYLEFEGVTLDMLKAPAKPERADIVPQGARGGIVNSASGLVGSALKSGTLGLSDHLEAGLSSILPIDRMIAWDGSKEANFLDYKGNLEAVRSRNGAQREGSPKSYLAGQIAGGILGAGKLASAGKLPSQMLKAQRGPVKGTLGAVADGAALAGADAGFNGRDVASEASSGGLIGAGINALTRGVGAPIGKAVLSKFRNKEAIPTVNQLKKGARQKYNEADSLDVTFTPKSVNDLVTGVSDDLSNPTVGLQDAVHTQSVRLLKDLQALSGKELDGTTLNAYRKRAKAIAGRIDASGSGNPDAVTGKIILQNIDDFIASNPAVSQGSRPASEIASMRKEADDLYRRGKAAETFTNALSKAERQTNTTGGGGNLDNKIRQAVERIRGNPRKSKFFTDNEMAAMDRASQGSRGQNSLRMAGKLSPEGSGLTQNMLMMGAGGGAATQSPQLVGVMAGLGATGFISKRAAERITTRKANEVLELIRAGSPDAANMSQSQIEQFVRNPQNRAVIERALIGAGVLGGFSSQNQ